jgi:gliding motility-associated-like protein
LKEQDYIADLFRDGLENHEVPVRPEIWQNVASRIDTAATFTDSTATTNPAAATIKVAAGIKAWIAGTAIVLTGAAGIVAYSYLNNPEQAVEQPGQQTESTQVAGSEAVNSTGTVQPIQNADPFSKTSDASPGNKQHQQPLSGRTTNDQETVTDSRSQDIFTESNHTGEPSNAVPTGTNADKHGAGTSVPNASQEAPTALPTQQTSTAQSPSQPWKLKIHADITEGTAPFETNFYVATASGSAEWVFEDNHPAVRGLSTRHRFDKPGRYTVTCRFTDPNGVISTENLSILVKPAFALSPVPNVFSPNGDGLNDEFAVKSMEGLDIELTVFDPSGKTIHRSKGAEATWNGRINDVDEAPEGTYFYIIFASGQIAAKGTVTLKR